ncbi:hypothetical protein [Candidatus Palauibacter sp.]|uniref:hypothetical protein n=1 Tax=Candidatus Palauibacter sp. TaxID=3101350 RepID=UPI003C6FCD82
MTPSVSPPPGLRPDLDEAVETWSRMGDASLLRGVAAVILGFAVLTFGSVLTGRLLISTLGVGPGTAPDTAFIGASLGTRLVITVLAGFLTALAAPRAPRVHAGVLAAILVFFSLASLAGLSSSGEPYGPTWYPVVMLVMGPVGVLAGGALRARRTVRG